jgi:hypothetical protein
MVITAGPLFSIQCNQDPLLNRKTGKKILFLHRAITPKNLFRLANVGHSFNPGDNALVMRVSGAKRTVAHAVSSLGLKRTILPNAIQDHFGMVHSRSAFSKNQKPTLTKWN